MNASAVSNDEAVLYKIVIDGLGIGHLSQEEIGISRIDLYANRQLLERFHHDFSRLYNHLHPIEDLVGVLQHFQALLIVLRTMRLGWSSSSERNVF